MRFAGKLKFFDEGKGYGFIIMDNDGSDIFCHFDDFAKAGIDLGMLKSAKLGRTMRVNFCCLNYIGRHNK
jgi:cold shock CspA family protein